MIKGNITLKIGSNGDGIVLQFLIAQYQPNRSTHVTARDSDILDDYAEIVFDFTGEGKAAYEFLVSVNGSTNDFSLDNKNRENRDWDGIWEYHTEVIDNTWLVEMPI